jgi:hypothetical protein
MFVVLKPITNYGFPHSLTARAENSVARGRPVVRPNIGANIGVVFIIREHDMLISGRADRSADLSSRVRALTNRAVLLHSRTSGALSSLRLLLSSLTLCEIALASPLANH